MSGSENEDEINTPLLNAINSCRPTQHLGLQGSYVEEHDEVVTESQSLPRNEHRRPRPSASVSLGLLLTFYVVCFVLVRVLLPIYSQNTTLAGGDAFTLLFYICIWFPVVLAIITILYKALWDRSTTLLPAVTWRVLWLMGALSLGNGFCSTFGSLPDRTPPYLQALLMTLRIPYTVLARLVILRKGLSLRRIGCTVAVLIGIFITIEPQIWSLPGSGSDSSGGSSTAHVIWPMIFAIGFLPAAINTVICERELKGGEAQSLSFITWSQVFQLFTILPLFWVDFIPFFGMAKSFDDFGSRMHNGFRCNFSLAEDCRGLVFKGWLFILGYCFGNLFQYLLIQHAEGAVFAVVVQSLVTPLATLFWTFFKFDVEADHFFWDPEFTETTGFTIGGLLIIVPAVVLYNVFSKWDAEEAAGKTGRLQEE